MEIELDFFNAMNQAQRLRSAGEQCLSQAQVIRDIANSLFEHWQGDSAVTMQEKYYACASEQTKIGDFLNSIASDIEKTAKDLKERDERLAAINTSSSYGGIAGGGADGGGGGSW